MKIVTYCKTLDLEECQEIGFDYDKAMIQFFLGGFVEEFYFRSAETALQFMHELIEAIYSGSPLADLSYITAIPGTLYVVPFRNEVKERIKNYNPPDDEDSK